MTELFTVLGEIAHDLEKVEEAAVLRVDRALPAIKPTEKALGTIHNQALKRLWTLASVYSAISKHAQIDAIHAAETDEQGKFLRIRAQRFSTLEDFVRALFWIQVKDEIGAETTWDADSISVRNGWMLVSGSVPSSALIELGRIGRPE